VTPPALLLDGIVKRVGGRVVLDGVSGSVAAGAVVALLGPAGAGKTTLLRLAAGLMSPDAGCIRIDGHDIAADAAAAQRAVGYLPQRTGVLERLTVGETMELYRGLHGLARRPGEARELTLLGRVGLDGQAGCRAAALTAAERQRLGIACALMGGPRLLLLDDPGAALDPLSSQALLALVRSLGREGMTTLWATADRAEAERCDRVLTLERGLIREGVPPGTAAALRTAPAGPRPEPTVVGHGLTRHFGRRRAVDGVGVGAGPGEILGLIGPGGAGKTTILRMLAGLLSPDAGTVAIEGADPRRAPPALRARIGYLPQSGGLHDELSLRRNLAFLAAAHGLDRDRATPRIAELLDAFELAEETRTPCAALSPSARRRAALAATLLHAPSTILLDEPTAGADDETGALLWDRIEAAATAGATVVVAARRCAEAARCDRALLLHEGRALAELSVDPRSADAATIEAQLAALIERSRDGVAA